MSISADRLRALREQAGDTTVRQTAPSRQTDRAPSGDAMASADAVSLSPPVIADASRGALALRARLEGRGTSNAVSARTPVSERLPSDHAQGAGPRSVAKNQEQAASSRENRNTPASGLQRRPIPAPDTARKRGRRALDWMDPPAASAAKDSHRRGLQPQSVDALRRLIATRERKPIAPAGAPATRRAPMADRTLPGEEISPGLHLIETFLPQSMPGESLSLAFAKRAEEAVAPRHLLFFDTETTGLAGGTGTRAFMVGAADWLHCGQRGPGLRIRQLMMSTMAAEGAMLRAFAQWLTPQTVLCSYNGRSYDAPLLKTRYRLARLPEPITALDHVDLLHPTRRRYRGTWENCKLATIERQLLRIVREDDLPGSEAPAAWLTYLRGGSARNLRRVAHHNHQDVVTLALLLQRLVAAEAEDREVLVFEQAP
jgi:uncharacterized protein YprB with RNaseH-like and TPR domain